MKRNLFEIKYFETYYFANVIKNLLDEPFAHLRWLTEYFDESSYLNCLEPFPKVSRLHNFIYWIIDSISYDNMGEIITIQKGENLWIDYALNYYKIDDAGFRDYLTDLGKQPASATDDDIYEYYQELRITAVYDTLLTRMSEEIFFILFMNRQLLHNFNQIASWPIRDYCLDPKEPEIHKYFKREGVLKRTAIPSWVQKAVYHRDRGICTNCFKDITGLVSIGNTKNFDHIVPLAEGGLNDITNIQLLCETCNKAKGKRQHSVSRHYEKWF